MDFVEELMSLDVLCLRSQRSIKVGMSCWHLKVQVRNSQKRYWLDLTLGGNSHKGSIRNVSVYGKDYQGRVCQEKRTGPFGSILV